VHHKKNKYGYPLCTLKDDVYKAEQMIGSETLYGYPVTHYSVVDHPELVIKKATCKHTESSLSSLGKAYADMYVWITMIKDRKFARICSDENLKPQAYLVVEGVAAVAAIKGGALCEAPAYRMGKQIGIKEQMEQSEDSLYVDFNNRDLIIKKITGGGSPYSKSKSPADIGKIYIDIYTEIKLTMKAASLGVGPRIVYSKICSDKNLKPVGYLVMERINGTYLRKDQIEQNALEIRTLIDNLYDARIEHGDLHNRNILIGSTPSNPEPRIWIIDYGDAYLMKPSQTERRYVVSYMSEIRNNAPLEAIYL
jgi:hypothetical protein